MRAGLAASTVTPGMTAPDGSRTTPAMLPVSACAHARAGKIKIRTGHTKTRRAILSGFIGPLLPRSSGNVWRCALVVYLTSREWIWRTNGANRRYAAWRAVPDGGCLTGGRRRSTDRGPLLVVWE